MKQKIIAKEQDLADMKLKQLNQDYEKEQEKAMAERRARSRTRLTKYGFILTRGIEQAVKRSHHQQPIIS